MQSLPLVLIPGLTCTARLYTPQVEALWLYGSIAVADHRRDDNVVAVAKRILDAAPPRFALAGLSYGGYIAFEMMRQASDRIVKLALLDTSARPDTSEQTAARRKQIAAVEAGGYGDIADFAIARYLHRDRQNDSAMTTIVRQMVAETGPEAFLRGLRAIIARPDSGPLLASIRCPTLVLAGDADQATPPDLAKEIAAGIAGSQLVIVADCGHLSTIERPAAVNAALAEWLQRPG